MKNFVLNNCMMTVGDHKDYEILSHYHYQPPLTTPLTRVWKIVGSGAYRSVYPDPLSVIVYMQPVPEITPRTRATNEYFHQFESHADNLKLLNQNVLYLSRLITDPRFLRKGLAKKLVRESLEQLDIPIVETLTPTDWTNQLYQSCGFKMHHYIAGLKYQRIMNAFRSCGIELKETMPPLAVQNRLDALQPGLFAYIEKEIQAFLGGFRNADRFEPGIERTKFIMTKIPPPTAYLIWFNPRNPKSEEIRSFNAGNENS